MQPRNRHCRPMIDSAAPSIMVLSEKVMPPRVTGPAISPKVIANPAASSAIPGFMTKKSAP